MGVKPIRLFSSACIFLAFIPELAAAPTLRLTSAAVGPVTVAQGSNGPTQTIEAYNAGDGSLSLGASSSAAWVSAAFGAPRNCSRRAGSCIPVQFSLNTASLAAGIFTAVVTISDANAIDAPQTVTVTAQVGGGVPGRIEMFTPPGGTAETTFYTNATLNSRVSTSNNTSWLTLSLSLDGGGSFQFAYPYKVKVSAGELGTGSYDGSVALSGSSFAGDNKTVPVTMRVTTQPILKLVEDVRPVSSVTAAGIKVRLAAGTPAYVLRTLSLVNTGQGTLAVSSAVATGGDWLSVVTAAPAGVYPVLNASALSPGVYNGSLAIVTNAANGNLTLPVELTVVAKGAPLVRFQGVVDNAVFEAGGAVCPGDILAVVGDQLTYAADTLGKAPPLATEVGGARVLVNGQPAPMYYATYGQLAFQLPVETPAGTAVVSVERDGQASNRVTLDVANRAPRLLRIGIGDFGAIVNAGDGSLPMPSAYQVSGFATHPARRGDTLTIYAIGLGPTSPAAATGAAAPSSPLARLTETPSVVFGGGPFATRAEPSFAGLTPTSAGLYQVNVAIPADSPLGIVAVSLGFAGSQSNSVNIAVE